MRQYDFVRRFDFVKPVYGFELQPYDFERRPCDSGRSTYDSVVGGFASEFLCSHRQATALKYDPYPDWSLPN